MPDPMQRVDSILLDDVPSYREFCARIILPDGPMEGQPYDPSHHPAQLVIIEALDNGYRRIVIAKPVQDGGTLVGMVPLLRRAILQGQRVLLSYPSLDVAKDIWTTKVQPILRSFGGQEPKAGGGKHGGAARIVTLPGGGRFLLRAAGGRGESQQASVTGDAVMPDEVDDWPSQHRIRLIEARVSKSPDPLVVLPCTVKDDHESKILHLFDEGTQTRIRGACPHCGALQVLEWEHVDTELECYRCEHCDEPWTDRERVQALRAGDSVSTKPDAITFSIRWSALDSPFPIMHEGRLWPAVQGLCRMFKEAQRKIELRDEHDDMRAFFRDRLTRQYLGDEQAEDGEVEMEITPRALAAKFAKHGWSKRIKDKPKSGLWSRNLTDPPGACRHAALACDVQSNRVYWALVGYHDDERTWDLAWGYELGNAAREPFAPGELMATLERVQEFADEWCADRDIDVSDRVVDTGHETKELVAFLREHREWRGIRGVNVIPKTVGKRGIGVIAYDLKWKPGLGRYVVVTSAMRHRVHDAYRKTQGEPGAAHLPRLEASDTYLSHLCSWRWEIKTATGNREDWVQHKTRDDWLDTRCYGHGVILYRLRMREIERSIEEPDETEAQPAASGGNWISGGGDAGWVGGGGW